MMKEGEPGEGMMLSDMAEVHQALAAGAVTLHTKIVSRVPQTDEDGNTYMKRFETTPVAWLHRDDGLLGVSMRTRAWRSGQRYTVSEPLLIRPDGTVLWR